MQHPAPYAAPIPVIVGTIGNNTGQACNARDLHTGLQVGRDFSNWIRGRIDEFGFVEGEDFAVLLAKSGEQDAQKIGRWGGGNRVDYLLTLDMAKELAMVENNDLGRAVRRYFIACEKRQAEIEPQASPELVRLFVAALQGPEARAAGIRLTVRGAANRGGAKLTAGQIEEILASAESNASLAARFGVHWKTVSRVRNGRTHSALTGIHRNTNHEGANHE